ncbi:MAG TPA: hypothetical protein VK961_00785 [Chthoniobacter sp.]|nr:hypothetical protein [Chthoniobacter sp.]
MTCRACGSRNLHACGKRYALYPVLWVGVIGPLLAQIHQLSAPFDYRCNDCGAGLARRTKLGRAARVGFWLLLGGYLLLANLWWLFWTITRL